MISSLFGYVFLQIAIGYCGFISERFVEFNDKIILEVFGNSAAVACGITNNLVFCRDYFDVGTFIKGIYNNIRMIVFRKSKAEKNSTFCRCHFGDYVMFCEIYFIIIRSGSLPFMRKPTGTLFFIKHRFANYWHDRELSVVINPWTGLMGLLETANFICGVGILPSVSHLSGLRCPEIHSPRTGYGRVSVAC